MSITKKRVLLFVITMIVLVMICSGVLYATSGNPVVEERDWYLLWGIRSYFYPNLTTTVTSVSSNCGNNFSLTSGKNIKKAEVSLWEEIRDKNNEVVGIKQKPIYLASKIAGSKTDGTLYSTGWLYLYDSIVGAPEGGRFNTRSGCNWWYF